MTTSNSEHISKQFVHGLVQAIVYGALPDLDGEDPTNRTARRPPHQCQRLCGATRPDS
jgi:hypothetical protein